jgi:hypothetical protein
LDALVQFVQKSGDYGKSRVPGQPQEFYGVRAWNLTPEWEFVFLALHAASHKWSGLKWLTDIHELCESATVDWDQVKRTVERFELDNFVGPTLTACSLLFGTRVPAQIPWLPVPPDVRLFPKVILGNADFHLRGETGLGQQGLRGQGLGQAGSAGQVAPGR